MAFGAFVQAANAHSKAVGKKTRSKTRGLLVTSKEQKIIALLEPEAIAQGFELVAIEIAGVGSRSVLRVLLDKAELTVDDLAAANVWVGALVDELDPFRGSYLLEVSSPGIDRPLRTPEHFVRFSGEQVRLSTEPLELSATLGAIAGSSNDQTDKAESAKTDDNKARRARWSGVLRGMQDDCVILECDGIIHNLPFRQIKKAHLVGKVDFTAAKHTLEQNQERRDN